MTTLDLTGSKFASSDVFCQDSSIVLATLSFAIIWLLDVSEKENRLYHAESRELNLPLVYVCRVEI